MYKIYNVKSGENIDAIARKMEATSDAIRKINGFRSDYEVKFGEQLVVPSDREQLFDVYIVNRGDTMYDIAKQYNISVDNLALLNGLDKKDFIYPGQEMLVPKSNVNFYVTKTGDTINSVSEYFDISTEELMIQNQTIYLLPEQLLVYKKEK